MNPAGALPLRTLPPLRVDIAKPRGELQLLDDIQAASRLGIAASTVKRLRLAGELPFVRIGKVARIEISALETFVSKRRVGGP